MLNKELLMTGGAEEELWTLHLNFTGDSYIDLILWDSTDQTHILWEGHPNNADIVAVRIPPKSTLLLTQSVGIYRAITQEGCILLQTRNSNHSVSKRGVSRDVLQSVTSKEALYA